MILRKLPRKLASLSGRELRDLFAAQWFLMRALWTVRTVRIGDLVTREENRVPEGNAAAVAGNSNGGVHARPTETDEEAGKVDRQRVGELVTALERVADRGVLRPLCLARSIALRDLLNSQGVEGSRVIIGVRRDGAGLLAHAWVEHNGMVLADRTAHVRKFTRLRELGVSGLK